MRTYEGSGNSASMGSIIGGFFSSARRRNAQQLKADPAQCNTEISRGQSETQLGRRGYQKTDLSEDLVERPRRHLQSGVLAGVRDAIPMLLVSAIVGVTLIWNAFVDLSFSAGIQTTAVGVLLLSGFFFLIAAYYRIYKPLKWRVSEIPLYAGLWFLFGFSSTCLSYLGIAAGAPLQDHLFLRADVILGLNWPAWNNFLSAYPHLNKLLSVIYESSSWQPLIMIPILAIGGVPGRNQELLTAMCIAIIPTIIISSFMPTFGPAFDYGANDFLEKIIAGLRRAHHDAPYLAGIVQFPSFHTVMVILFTWAHRRMWTFWAFLMLNTAMLFAIPTVGDHYFVDMLGGAVIAIGAIWGATRLRSHYVLEKAWATDGP